MLHVAGYEELAVWFKPIKSGEYFEWMYIIMAYKHLTARSE